MPLSLFQSLCVMVLVTAYALDLRRHARPLRRLSTIGLLALAAGVGEHTVIAAYGYYRYADGWWLRLGHVPLLVPLIWPLVILSARDVVESLWPGGTTGRRALRVAAVVVFDAALIEVCAVAAGLWRWAEGGYLGVPLMGITGWGCFAFAASLWLDRPRRLLDVAAPALLVAAAHVLILAWWWGLFRWGPRADLGPDAVWGFAAVAAAYTASVAVARRRRPPLERDVSVARGVATSVFVALLLALPGAVAAPLWAHFALTAAPYLWASAPLGRAVPAAASTQEDVLGKPGP